jgi:DnaK suppressor protein
MPIAMKKEEEVVKTRYSDEELEEFKALILEKLAKAREDLLMLTEAYTNIEEHGISDTSPTFKVLEEGYQVLSKEENSRLAARQQKFINALENALIRIENKTYGICRATGKLISKERLRSVPHATLSIDAKLGLNKKT